MHQSRPSYCVPQLRANELLAKKFIHKGVWLDALRSGELLDHIIHGILQQHDETAILDVHFKDDLFHIIPVVSRRVGVPEFASLF